MSRPLRVLPLFVLLLLPLAFAPSTAGPDVDREARVVSRAASFGSRGIRRAGVLEQHFGFSAQLSQSPLLAM